MKALILAGLLVAATTTTTPADACLVPSLLALDKRLAGVGIDPTPFKWSLEAQLRIVDERRDEHNTTPDGKKITDIPKRTMLWVSGKDGNVIRAPVAGEATRALKAVRLAVENTFSFSSVPEPHQAAVSKALAVIGSSTASSSSTASFHLHSLDCSQRTKSGWFGMACDVEVGPAGKTLLSIANGKVSKGVLRGPIVNHDVGVQKKAGEGMEFSLMCDTEEDDDGKSAADAFALVISVKDDTNEDTKATHDRAVEVVIRFKRSAEGALADDSAPTTVIDADGSSVYLLRGNTIFSRWLLPLIYGVALIAALPHAARWATKALTPKAAPVTVDPKDMKGSSAVTAAKK